MRFPWFWKANPDLKKAKEEARVSRGVLATKITELEEQRHLLDGMVKRSLELMEHKKP